MSVLQNVKVGDRLVVVTRHSVALTTVTRVLTLYVEAADGHKYNVRRGERRGAEGRFYRPRAEPYEPAEHDPPLAAVRLRDLRQNVPYLLDSRAKNLTAEQLEQVRTLIESFT